MPPTIYTGVDNAARLAREEIFGPVVVVIPFDAESDAVAMANDSDYGLIAGGPGTSAGDPGGRTTRRGTGLRPGGRPQRVQRIAVENLSSANLRQIQDRSVPVPVAGGIHPAGPRLLFWPGMSQRPVPAREPHLVVPVAQGDPARRGPGPLPGAGSDRHGRIREARHRLPLRRSRSLSGRLVRRARPDGGRDRRPSPRGGQRARGRRSRRLRAPYPDPASRKPLLVWPREIPVDGEPADVHERMLAYGRWMADTSCNCSCQPPARSRWVVLAEGEEEPDEDGDDCWEPFPVDGDRPDAGAGDGGGIVAGTGTGWAGADPILPEMPAVPGEPGEVPAFTALHGMIEALGPPSRPTAITQRQAGNAAPAPTPTSRIRRQPAASAAGDGPTGR